MTACERGEAHTLAAAHALQAALTLLHFAADSIDRALAASDPPQNLPDARQPGAAPPANAPSLYLAVDAENPDELRGRILSMAAAPEPIDTTPEPEYRAALEGTVPPVEREWRCGTCGALAGPIMRRSGLCGCGGEIVQVDLEPPVNPCLHANLWRYQNGARRCDDCGAWLDPQPGVEGA